MNWYKRAQEIQGYMDVGHYGGDDEVKGKTVVLWISNLSGGEFLTREQDAMNDDTHYQIEDWDVQSRESNTFRGRYDPMKNAVMILMPFVRSDHESLYPEDVPNRLINNLTMEFPGSSIYTASYKNMERQITQII